MSPCARSLSLARLGSALAFLLFTAQLLLAQNPVEALRRGFLNPPEDARAMMRWWWFGPAVVKPELGKELETMRKAGMGGVEIQPVYPLMLDDPAKGIVNLRYLSPEFLDDVSFVNEKAHALGLRVSMTLGSGWPYGGPTTTLALAAGRLKVIAVPVRNGTASPPSLAQGDTMIAAFLVAGAEKSFDPASAKRFDPAGPLPDATGDATALYFISSHTRQMVKRAAFGAEGYVLDHFSRAAIDEHLKDVATPLVNAFGNQPPYSVFSDSLEVYGSDWTANLPAEFKRLRGYDLVPHLPELLAGGTPEAEAVRHDWGETLSDLIRENYLAPLTHFAEAHGTLFRSQTYGDPAVTLADESVPNLPEGEGPQWRAFSYARWASSASHLYSRNVTSAETWTWLHSPVFRATPLDMKAEADRMFLIGINQFVGHGFPYSPPAAGEPGWAFYAAAVFNAHNPWFPVMPDVMRYLQRVSWLLRQGQPASDVAILLPEDDAQAAFSPGHVSVTAEMPKHITPELMGAILDAGYNVDYIDAATIDKLGKIPYPILILPPTDRIPLAAYRKIAAYADTGHVIAIGKLPSLAPGLLEQNDAPAIAALSQRIFEHEGHRGDFIGSVSELADALHRALHPDLAMTGTTEGLGFIHRRLANADIYFLANTGNKPIDGAIAFRSSRSSVEAWDPDSGRVLFTARNGRGAGIPLALAPYESRVFVLADRPAFAAPVAQHPEHQELLGDLSTGWSIHFAGALVPLPLSNLVSWTNIPGMRNFSGEADYTRNFSLPKAPAKGARIFLDFGQGTPIADNRPPGASGMHALLDPPIREAAIVFVNGRRVGSLWHPPYRIDITQFLHANDNRAEVRVYNTAINELAGRPPHDYSALWAKYGQRFAPQDMENLHPIPSGLFGPIRLIQDTSE
ncbi:MAG TPA: glycosyl hydrolase [Terracidiphilus sp.]|nr:glycosyl hydrolase [Terracidiphilus sp.]